MEETIIPESETTEKVQDPISSEVSIDMQNQGLHCIKINTRYKYEQITYRPGCHWGVLVLVWLPRRSPSAQTYSSPEVRRESPP